MKKGISLLKYDNNLFLIKGELKKRRLRIEYKKFEKEDENLLKNKKPFVSFETKDGLVVGLRFPFKGRKKIAPVLKNELESLIPFPVEEIILDFKEIPNGNTITLSTQKSIVEPLKNAFHPQYVTNNTVSALFAFTYFNIAKEKDFALLHIEGSIFTIFIFKNRLLDSIHQSYFQKGDFIEKIKEYIINSNIEALYFIGETTDTQEIERFLKSHNIRLIKLDGKDYFDADGYPEWVWAGAGISLLSILRPKNEINLLREERGENVFDKYGLLIITFLSISAFFTFMLLYIDLNLKKKAYSELAGEEIKVYRRVFPGSPPVFQIEKILKEKIKETASEGTTGFYSSPITILGSISKNLDPSLDVKLNDLNIDEKGFSISGATTSFSSVEKIKEGISNISNVKETVIEVIEPSGSQVKFKIRGVF